MTTYDALPAGDGSPTHRVVFTPSGLSGDVPHGVTVLEAARRLGADLDTVCGGRGICGRCQIVPTFGAFPKWRIESSPGALGQPVASEIDYRGARPLVDGRRLGCAAAVLGDVVADIPAESQVHRQVVRKDLDLPAFAVDPFFTLWYVEAGVPEQVGAAVAEQHGRAVPTVPAGSVAALGAAIDEGHGALTVAIDDHDRVAVAWPGFVDAAFGIAVDIGSTTLAGHLCDLTTGEVKASAGRMNPQIRFGEDLMSRVSYVMMHPEGAHELTAVIRDALDELVGELLTAARGDRERVLEIVLVGNPVMHHIVLGIDPTPLGQAPFPLTVDQPLTIGAGELDLALPNARCYVAPCIAGHVGADTAAAILSWRQSERTDASLLVDVGTNAEIVLDHDGRLFAASSPTGPAFEGAQLSSGQRATTGAIEAVRIDRDTLEPHVRVIGVDMWSHEPGFEDAVAATGVTGVCGSGVIDAIAEMYLAGVCDRNGVIDGAVAERSPRVRRDDRTFSYVLYGDGDGAVAITQNDVRAIQLAKAALRAGIDLLVERAGSPAPESISLAGAFGAHIDPVRATVLGLVPDAPAGAVVSVGNAAGTGAVEALLSRSLRAEMERAVRDVTKIETATEPRFQELFVAAMALPHADAPTPHLAHQIDLPVVDVGAAAPRRRRRGARHDR